MSQFPTTIPSFKWSPLQLLATQSFLVGLSMSLLFAIANTNFLIDYSSDQLPFVYVVAAFVIPAVTYLYNRYAKVTPLSRLLIAVNAVIVMLYLGSWLIARSGTIRWVSFALLVLFLTLFVFQLVMLSTQATRLFDLRQMKSTYPLVLASQTGAIIVGGLSVSLLTNLLGGVTNLLIICVVLAGGQTIVVRLTMSRFPLKFSKPGRDQLTGKQTTYRDMMANRFSRHIAGYQFFSAFGTEMIVVIFTIWAERQFQEAEALASFYGAFMATGTFLTLLFLILAAGRLLRRYGLGYGIMGNPTTAGLLVLGIIIAQLTAAPVIVVFSLVLMARIADFVMSVSTTDPSLKTMYQAFPEATRPSLITSIEAISIPLSYGVLGGSLILIRALNLWNDPFILAYTAVVCVIWTTLGWRTYRLYSETLLNKLGRRSFDEGDLSLNDPQTMAVVNQLAKSDQPAQVRTALNLLQKNDADQYRGTLLDLLHHNNRSIQLEILKRLEDSPEIAKSVSFASFFDPNLPTDVRAAALQTSLAAGHQTAALVSYQALQSPESNFDFQLASLVGLMKYGGIRGQVKSGQFLLELLESDGDADQELAAKTLATLDHHNFHQPIPQLLQSRSSKVRGYALEAAGKVRHPSLIPAIIAQLEKTDSCSPAIDALLNFGADILPEVERNLSNNIMTLPARMRLVRMTGHLSHQEAAPLLLQNIQHKNRDLRSAVISSLVRTGYQATIDQSKGQINTAIQAESGRTGLLLSAIHSFESDDEHPIMLSALQADLAQTTQRIFSLLACLYDASSLIRVGELLRIGTREEQAQAVESIDLLLSTPHKRLVMPLIDHELTTQQRLAALPNSLPPSEATSNDWLITITNDQVNQYDDWTQACAIYSMMERDDGSSRDAIQNLLQHLGNRPDRPLTNETARWAKHQFAGEKSMLTIEKVLLLKETDIFKHVPESLLASVAALLEVIDLPEEQTFIRDGDLANEMFIIVEGAVQVRKNGKPIIDLKSGDSVGELAIFDTAPRSADVVTLSPTALLRLEKDALYQVMADRPEISSGIIQTLSRRIREQGRLMTS